MEKDLKRCEKNRGETNVYKYGGKRLFDLLLSFLAFVCLLPLLIAVGGLVYCKLGSPVLFKQKRPGKDEKIFEILKFRTMVQKQDSKGTLLPDDKRMTHVGKILRSTSIDELPELINIIKGDMSIVGPRPLLVEYLPLYNETQRKRHLVRPGLTGLAQVNGRNKLTWEEKFRYDVEYVEKLSFWLDVRIILQTIKKVWKKEGITSDTGVIVEAFKGSK